MNTANNANANVNTVDLGKIDRLLSGEFAFYFDDYIDSVYDTIEYTLLQFDTCHFTEEQYREYESIVDRHNEMSGNNKEGKYSVSYLYDVSGFEYWKNAEESNYVVIRVTVFNDLDMDDIRELGDRMNNLYYDLRKANLMLEFCM